MLDKVIERLQGLGYTPDESDMILLEIIIQIVTNSILNLCNLVALPSELLHVVVDRTCGEFFNQKKAVNSLEIGHIDFESVGVKSLQMGDTNIGFAVSDGESTSEQRLNALIQKLLNSGEGELICFRRLKW